MKVQRVLLLGPPASGKGTQARQLAAHLNVPCLGTGKLLRSEIEKGSEIGVEADKYINKGEYVPDALIMKMVNVWISENSEGWLLDGFPRTLPQAEALQEMAQPDRVIALDVPQEELEFRITKRRECTSCGVTVAVDSADDTVCPECKVGELVSRSDDAIDSFKVRYANYEELTSPLFDYYESKGMLQRVDGTQSPADVFAAILEKI